MTAARHDLALTYPMHFAKLHERRQSSTCRLLCSTFRQMLTYPLSLCMTPPRAQHMTADAVAGCTLSIQLQCQSIAGWGFAGV